MRKLQVLTNSEIEAFDNCPAMHGYGYHELLRPKLTPYRLSRGTIGHAGIAAGWRAASTDETHWLPALERVELAKRGACQAIDGAVAKVQSEIRKNVELEGANELLDQADESGRICRFVCDRYFELRKDELDCARYALLAVEAPFEILLRNERGNATKVQYSGVVDLVLLDLDANSIRIEDHKFPEKPGISYEKKLPLSTQLTGYVYAVRELAKLRSHPFWSLYKGQTELWSAQVGAIGYNLLKAKLPAQPSINQNGMVSVAKLDTTPEIYADALFEQKCSRDLEISQKQREFLDALRAKPPWITKLEFYRGEDEIQRWLAETRVKAAQIRETERRPELRVRRSGYCTGMAAPRCAFDSVCMDPTSQHTRDAFYRVATSRHEEIEVVEQHGSEKENEPW